MCSLDAEICSRFISSSNSFITMLAVNNYYAEICSRFISSSNSFITMSEIIQLLFRSMLKYE